MFRSSISGRPVTAGAAKPANSGDGATTTIREIKSRANSTLNSSNARQLLANRRQAASMDKLNVSGNSSSSSSNNNNNNNEVGKDLKSSPPSSNNSINSSPNRNNAAAGLNRTASRVSRFRTAKAVFERLSKSNASSKTPEKSTSERSRGAALNRYTAAAAAAAAAAATKTTPTTNPLNASSSLTSSPARRRIGQISTMVRSQESTPTTKSSIATSSAPLLNVTNSPKLERQNISNPQPRPSPRFASTRTTTSMPENRAQKAVPTIMAPTASITPTLSAIPQKPPIQAKPPPQDLIDKIVLEIAKEPDPDCTIQDLSNCDVSNIPDTLDFEKCFQDVEMMTEEEAKKLLSRNRSPVLPLSSDTEQSKSNVDAESHQMQVTSNKSQERMMDSSNVSKNKVRFSNEPVTIFDTHAIEDYDRRNFDIDPAAASAEYELEKSKERQGIVCDSDDEEGQGDSAEPDCLVDKPSSDFSGSYQQIIEKPGICYPDSSHLGAPHSVSRDNPQNDPSGIERPQRLTSSGSDGASRPDDGNREVDIADTAANKEYVESLERELSLKRILEQNLRDLQSQYYEAVKELDEFRSTNELKISELVDNISELKKKLEYSNNELVDSCEKSRLLDTELATLKESSQLVEKKYHRAKKIIKDMQSRELSFNKREQLYQQKLDEIEFELGALINSIDRTVQEDALRFFSLHDAVSCQRQHQVRFDVFGLLRQMLNNFSADQSTQNSQIKQRVVTILEQQLAILMASTNGNSSSNGNVDVDTKPISTHFPIPIPPGNGNGSLHSRLNEDIKRNQNRTPSETAPASHRLSQPNLPHPVGVGGQPTKIFHAFNPIPAYNMNEPSPPQSVNSYPSNNSLNSLNNNVTCNNNNNSASNNNNLIMAVKMREQPPISDLQSSITPTSSSRQDDSFQPVPDMQGPFQSDEWHDKPVSEWTTTQVSTWLLALGLDQYISKFEDRNVNGQSLINLDSTVLKGLGVLNSADRNLLKKKIRELRTEMEKERKQIEKKMKESLKDKSKNKSIANNGGGAGNGRNADNRSDVQQSKSSWTRGLLS